MALSYSAIAHRYETTVALEDVSFTAERGAVTCLLGPSGCGKTTLLNLTAGILRVQSGDIRIDGRLLANASTYPPPERRPVGLVFQDGALFPHMTVGQNVAFGLNQPDTKRVESLLAQVGLAGFASRMPAQLSGGQQQRVALIRALAPEPSVVLMDEPFANIDNQLRRSLREDTRVMLRSSDSVAILVTHDPEEAIEIADQIVIMEDGGVIQIGTSADIYDEPLTVSVAAMFGNGQLLPAELIEGRVITPFGDWPVDCLKKYDGLHDSLTLVVRPSAVTLSAGPLPVTDRRSVGPYQRVIVTAPDGSNLICHEPTNSTPGPLAEVSIVPAPGSIFAFPRTA